MDDQNMYDLITMPNDAPFQATRVHRLLQGPAGRGGVYHADAPLRCGTGFADAARTERGLTPQYALVYLSVGSAQFVDDQGRTHEVGPGMAFQRFPDRPHQVRYRAETRQHHLAVPAEVFSLLGQLGLGTLEQPVLDLGTEHTFVRRHARLTEELRSAAPMRLPRVLVAMQELLVDMHLHAQARTQGADQGERIEQACLILSSDLDRKLAMPDVARELGVSYPTFRRQFRAATGFSPGDYRIRRRIERAQELIAEGVPAIEVAARLGYVDVFALSAQFRRFTGLSPRQYRQQRGA